MVSVISKFDLGKLFGSAIVDLCHRELHYDANHEFDIIDRQRWLSFNGEHLAQFPDQRTLWVGLETFDNLGEVLSKEIHLFQARGLFKSVMRVRSIYSYNLIWLGPIMTWSMEQIPISWSSPASRAQSAILWRRRS
jgi:hypothetical protein